MAEHSEQKKQTYSLVQNLFPGNMLAVVVYRHGIADDLKALIQGAIVLATGPFLSIVDQPENLPCIAVWPDVLTAPLAAGGFLVQAGTAQQGTILPPDTGCRRCSRERNFFKGITSKTKLARSRALRASGRYYVVEKRRICSCLILYGVPAPPSVTVSSIAP